MLGLFALANAPTNHEPAASDARPTIQTPHAPPPSTIPTVPSQLWIELYLASGNRLFTAENATHQWIRRTEEKRTEFNLRSCKSEAEVRLIIEDCARRSVLFFYWQTRSNCAASLRQQGYLFELQLVVCSLSDKEFHAVGPATENADGRTCWDGIAGLVVHQSWWKA